MLIRPPSPSTRLTGIRWVAASLLAGVAIGLTTVTGATERPTVRVGIVIDGPPGTDAPDSPGASRYGILPQIIEETLALTGREIDVRFPADKRAYGAWEAAAIRSGLGRLLADPEVDLVLTLGPFSSAEAVSRVRLEKPVVAPFVIDPDVENAPRDGNASGVHNLAYVTLPLGIRDQLSRFREIVGFDRVHLVFDELILEFLPEIPRRTLDIASSLGVEGVLVPLSDSPGPAADALPDGGQAVFLFPLPRFTREATRALIEIANRKGIPTLACLSDDLLEDGALMSLAPEENLDRLARRVALDIQRILLGEEAGSLPVALDQEERLQINMETARRIGWYPTWETLIQADLLNEETREASLTWSLDGVAHEAVQANLDLLAQQRALAAGRQDVREAQAGVRPQIDLRATGVLIDEDRAASSFGQQPQRTLSAGVRLNQLLWSNRAFGNVGVQADIQRSRESGYEASRMDVVLEATQAFLDVLRAQTLERIRRQNARLTEDNLRLAERRRDLGAGGPADVYRWRSQLATDRQDAIAARQRVEIARALLNRILHRPIEEPFAAETPDLLDPSLVTGQGRLRPYIDDPWSFEVFRDFMVADGLVRAPELEALDASIEAAQASRRIAVRSLWAPDIALFGDLSERLATGGAGSDPALPLPGLRRADDRDWSLGLQASFPLFSGGAKWAHLRRSSETLQELRLQRKAAEERIELRIRTSLFRIASSSPAIGLSREAAGAARQNLDLVRDAYSRGSVPILDLLDAQNAALVADQVASNAVFDFLIDLMEVQRATVNYDFFRSSEEREAWFRKVDDYFESAGPPRPSEGGER